MRQSTMTVSERAELLARHTVARARQVDLLAVLDRDAEHTPPEVLQELNALGEEIGGLWEQYLNDLPIAALSRSPLSGDLLEYAIDTSGLDGLWWNYGQPLRPLQQLPADFVGLAGALCLSAPLEKNAVRGPARARTSVCGAALACTLRCVCSARVRFRSDCMWGIRSPTSPSILNRWETASIRGARTTMKSSMTRVY